jgi:phosphoglycolate phosphatase
MSLFIFDFDGTLSDSTAFICETMKLAFKMHDFSVPSDDVIRNIIGISLNEAIFHINQNLSHEQVQKIAKTYKNLFIQRRNEGLMHDALFNGALDFLKFLKTTHHSAAIATGKSLNGLNSELDRYQIRDYFVTYQTSDTHPSKPDPSMIYEILEFTKTPLQDAIMIGDTSYDMLMAKSAQIKAVGVSWGCHDTDTLKKAGAEYIVTCFSELKKFI